MNFRRTAVTITYVALVSISSCSRTCQTKGIVAAHEPTLVFLPPSEADLAKIAHPELREELLAMVEADQTARRAVMQAEGKKRDGAGEEVARIDRRNTARLKQIVEEHGWPTRSMVGGDGAQAAWLLVQHADHDLAWQRKCLAMMTPLVERDEVFAGNIAYLTDRVLVNEGKLQRYATQFYTQDGELVPRPMEDPDNVDKRRKSMGLSTLAEYKELMRT